MRFAPLLLVLCSTAALANQRAQGWCSVGGQVVVTNSVQSTTKVQRSYPQCTVTVYPAGSNTPVPGAQVYSDNSGTVLGNPFTATTAGYWFFYAANGHYDVTISGSGLSTPFTFGDILLADPAAGSTVVSSLSAGNGISVSAPTGASTVSAQGFAYVPFYVFSPQSPGGALTSGIAATVTLTPCPRGVNGSNVGYSMHVSGGTGTAESVLITGGTCTSLATTGTVIFTPANNHSGAWTIGPNAGGLDEALQDNTYPVVYVPGSITAYGPVTLSYSVTLVCASGTTITASGFSSGQSALLVGANNVTIRDCAVAAGTAGAAIGNSGTHGGILIDHTRLSGGARGVWFTAGSDITVTRSTITGFTATGIALETSVNIGFTRIEGNYVDASSSTALNGGGIGVWGSHTTISHNNVVIGGNQDQGIVWLNNPGAGLTDGTISDNTIFVNGANAFECIGVASADSWTMTGNTCKVNVTLAGVGFLAFEANRCSNGTLSGNQFAGNASSTGPVTGIELESPYAVTVTGNTVTGWGNNTASIGFSMVHTGTNPVGNTMSNNVVSGNTIVQTTANATTPEMRVETLAAGTVANNVFANNTLTGTSTNAGHYCFRMTNSGAATSSGHRVIGNTVSTCDTGISVATGTGISVENNRISNANTILEDLATGTLIVDRNGIPFSFLASQANGSVLFCSNCNSTCAAGASNGRTCFRENSAWVH